MKYYLSVILGFIVSMSNNLESYIDQEIKDSIRKSKPEVLELLLSQNKLSKEEKTDLLDLAEEILKINNKKLSKNNDGRQSKKRAQARKLYLSGGIGAFSLLVSAVGVSEVYSKWPNITGELPTLAFFTIISYLSLNYSVNLYNKIRNSRTLKQKYLDSLEIKQILNRA